MTARGKHVRTGSRKPRWNRLRGARRRANEYWGAAKSLAMYYAIPGRAARLARLYQPYVPDGGLCFDVGAHVGNRVRAFRALGARVIAIEPQAVCVDILKRLYGRDPHVTIMARALGKEPGQTRLWSAGSNLTVATASAEWVEQSRLDPGFANIQWRAGDMVTVTTLDRLIDEFGVPAFVKIDVEGFEAAVLDGLSIRLPALSFEYLAGATDITMQCLDRLAMLGRYEFNWSTGESHRMAHVTWVDITSIRRFVGGLAPGDGSGDIYARLVKP